MRIIGVIAVSLVLFSCSETTEQSTTESDVVRHEFEDTTSLVEYDINEQPLILFYFFNLTPDQIGVDFCYDDQQVRDLLMGGIEDEYGWKSSKVSDNYLRIENSECFVTTEFCTHEYGGGETYAYLIQTSKSAQQITLLGWNEGGQNWAKYSDSDYPIPKMTDFFADLTEDERALVKNHGFYFAYLNENTRKLKFMFSTWQMGLNLDGKEILDFDKEPDFTFHLERSDDNGFWLKKTYEDKAMIPKRYFLAYSETGETSEDFSWFLEDIKNGLQDYQVETLFVDFSKTNYQAAFAADTFDLSSMQQFESRNGFWFYERGKEPLDLGCDQVQVILPQAKRYFDEHF